MDAVKGERGDTYHHKGFIILVRGMEWQLYEYNLIGGNSPEDNKIEVYQVGEELLNVERIGQITLPALAALIPNEKGNKVWRYDREPGTILSVLRYICLTHGDYARWFTKTQREEASGNYFKSNYSIRSSPVDLIKGAEERMEKVIENYKERFNKLTRVFGKGKKKAKKPEERDASGGASAMDVDG